MRREKETVRKAETCLFQRKSLLVQELNHRRRSQKKKMLGSSILDFYEVYIQLGS